MSRKRPWVVDENAALLTDLYQIRMLQAYRREGLEERAVFSLYFRALPAARNYMLACGLDDVLAFLETLRFGDEAIDYLASLEGFSADFLSWLRGLRFGGDVYAVPEGVPVFPDEPILEIVAPLPEAQLVESFVMNQIHLQTVLATKAARMVLAAEGRTVLDFGLRRMHGTDAALKGARAFHIAGVEGTSNTLAGQLYGIPVRGTMAHSYIQAHDEELQAFRAYLRLYPETVVLVDTYDSIAGVEKLVQLHQELGTDFRVRGIRLDSGNLAELACEARRILNVAGLGQVEIFASGGLDEHAIAALVRSGAPIDGFGVGTAMGVSQDEPCLDLVYKLVEYRGVGRLKTSHGKPVLPGRKQVFRSEKNGSALHDTIARHDEKPCGRPLLECVMSGGRRAWGESTGLDGLRQRARSEIARLPAGVRALTAADPPYRVEVSQQLAEYQREVLARHQSSE